MKFGYARVSTIEQNLELQQDALVTAGAERIFVDKASGVAVGRPGLADLFNQARRGDCVVVWRLDRLARSQNELIQLAESLAQRGIELQSITEAIDTTTPAGKFVFHLFGALAEFERNLIRERTTAGLSAARARGRCGGRRPVLDAAKMKAIDLQLAAAKKKGQEPNTSEIGRSVGASERTIRRYLTGKYKTTGATA